MNRIDHSRFLLYIEPKAEQKSKEPVDDEITKIVKSCFAEAKAGAADYSNLSSDGNFMDGAWRGSHWTDCGHRSDNRDYLLGNGMITNSLCVFYLRYYRDAIPNSEMRKVNKLCEWKLKL